MLIGTCGSPDLRGYRVAGRALRALLWLKTVRKIDEGRRRHFIEVWV